AAEHVSCRPHRKGTAMTQIPPPGAPPMEYAPVPKPQGLAITAMVLGIVSIVLFCVWYISIPLGILAIILAIVARGKISRGEASGEGMAKAGLILGILGTAIG